MAAFVLFAGCQQAPNLEKAATGAVAVYVKDAPSDEFQSVFVTFDQVEVHWTSSNPNDDVAPHTADPTASTNDTGDMESWRWDTVVNETQTIDLKEFSEDASAFLGGAEVLEGTYTQIRIHVSDAYGISSEDNETRVNITVPSKTLKIVRPWTVTGNNTTVLTIDFDLDQSLHEAGQSGKWILRPVMMLSVETRNGMGA